MIRYFLPFVVIMGVCGLTNPAYGEKSTELFIPIGQSPGLSEKYTVIGKIDTVDHRNRTVTMSNPSGTYTARISEHSNIYLDRSRLQKTNQYGSWTDLKRGMKAEVYYGEKKEGVTAEWIKVQVE